MYIFYGYAPHEMIKKHFFFCFFGRNIQLSAKKYIILFMKVRLDAGNC